MQARRPMFLPSQVLQLALHRPFGVSHALPRSSAYPGRTLHDPDAACFVTQECPCACLVEQKSWRDTQTVTPFTAISGTPSYASPTLHQFVGRGLFEVRP